MKALLKKDMLVLGRQMRLFLLMIAIFAVLPGANMSIFAIVYCGMLPYVAMAYDERSKWTQLAAMMPYTPGDIVLSKYALGWLSIGTATAISVAAHLILGHILPSAYSLTLSEVLPSLCIGFIMMAVTLPLMFRFGVEKGRVLFIFLIVALVCGGVGVVQGVVGPNGEIPASLNALFSLGIPALAMILTAISIPLSIVLYNQHKYA
jgi:hypothetical protein